jgi:hypothetical protein
MTTSTSPSASSRSSSNGASGSSLSPFRSFLSASCNTARHLGATLNWRRDPVVEMQIERSEQRTKQLRSEIERIEKEIALLDWMHSEIDLIEADLPSSSTPPPAIAARSSDY